MFSQIEKNLSNNINEELFDTGKIFEINEDSSKDNTSVSDVDNTGETFPRISRAEYIKQARESCLRQMDSSSASRAYQDTSFPKTDSTYGENTKKRVKNSYAGEKNKDFTSIGEMDSFKFLIIRIVCALVIFFSVFVVDKFEIKFGGFSHEVVREYVTGNDQLKKLEEMVVSLLD